MSCYLVAKKLKLTAAIVAGFVLTWSLRAPAQDQDITQQIDNLRKEISFLSGRVCGSEAVKDDAADMRKQMLTKDAQTLNALLDQQKSKLTGNDFDTTLRKQRIDDEEKALAQPCPSLPADMEKLVSAGGGTAAAPAATATPTPQVSVTPPSDFGAQTIGAKSDPQNVTVTNSSGGPLDLFVWYGTHLENFKVSENSCDTSVPDKGSCSFKVSFAPRTLDFRDERLRVVSRRHWEDFEKVRRAYEDQGQGAVDRAIGEVENLRKRLKPSEQGNQSPTDFCKNPKGGDEIAKACNTLIRAIASRDELQKSLKPDEKKIKSDVDRAANTLRDQALAVIPLSGTANHWKYPLTRAVVGLDVSAVSSQTVKQAYFVDFNLLAPFKLPGMKGNEDALENRLWFWLNPRITSLPKATDFSALSTINESGSFFTNFSDKGKAGDIAQGFDVNGGLELAVLKPRDGIPWWAEYVNTKARLGASLILGAGVSTPFSIDNTDVPSQVNQSICDAFKAPAGVTVSGPSGLVCTFPSGSTNPAVVAPNPAFDPTNPMSPATVQDPFINFITPPRSRFFRRYYGGLRLKTHFFSPDVKSECGSARKKEDCEAPYDIFPGIIDITAGQDEAVTAGRLKNVLFRVEGVYPLPFVPGLHVFGSIYTSFKGDHLDQPFNAFTVNAPTNGASNDLNTFRFAVPSLNRDYFRLGIGVDLIQVIKRNKGGQPTNNTSKTSEGDNSGTATPAGK